MIITIDGPAGTGKSTVAKILSEKLDFLHMDTGAFYRALTYGALLNKLSMAEEIEEFALKNPITVDCQSPSPRYYIGNIDTTAFIRTAQVTEMVSTIASYPKIREILIHAQREFAKGHDVVCEGRDMGSYVFPDADVQFFLTADLSIRAERRFEEMKSKGLLLNEAVSLENVMEEIKIRDYKDSNRSINPLSIPKNAHIIDTTHLSIDEVVDHMLTTIETRKKSS